MAVKARMLFEFDGDTENGELVLKEGDIVTVLNKDIGDGWWEGETASGQTGLFPESYCEGLQTTEDGGGAVQNGETTTYEWDDQDDWDNQEQRSAQPTDNARYDYTEDRASVGGGSTSRTISPGNQTAGITGRHGTVKKNINRFSPFVKTGTEGFVLHNISVKRDVKQSEWISVVVSRDEECLMWRPPANPFTVEVRDPEKKKKFKGIKSFVAYSVIPSTTNRPVSRRYKHYDWLHDRLMEKFTILSVPPLPDKRYQSRFGEEFVEKRRAKLQMWTNRVARHPVLSTSDVFQHFVTCGDADQGEWKAGKRRAEKDELVGGALFLTVDSSSVTVDVRKIENQMEGFGVFRKSMEENCIKLRDRMMIHCNTMAGPFLQEWHRMAAAIHGLGQCFQQENRDYAKGLNQAIGFTADTYREIGTMHSVQPKNDTLPAIDVLKEYLGLLHEFPDTTDMYKGCLSKVRDCERMKEEGRIDIVEAGEIQERSEKVAGVLQAEMIHFQRERVIDFRQMMREMLQEQISFYKEITGKLESALDKYNEDTSL